MLSGRVNFARFLSFGLISGVARREAAVGFALLKEVPFSC